MTTVWLVGNFDPPDTARFIADVAILVPDAELVRFENPGEASRSHMTPADLVIVVLHRPAEFSRHDVDALIGSQPLARFIVALGPWCASHGRSERAWPEATTVPLREAPARLRREAATLAARAAGWPLTAALDEVLLCDTGSLPSLRAMRVLIETPDRAFQDLLSDLVRDAAGEPVAAGAAPVVLFDADPLDENRLSRLRSLRDADPASRIVALVAVPSAAECLLQQAGADVVVSKPFAIDDLLEAITVS